MRGGNGDAGVSEELMIVCECMCVSVTTLVFVKKPLRMFSQEHEYLKQFEGGKMKILI